ncbi:MULTISPECIES: DUF2470 domain-containing protein [unclassified Aeromicrobium]|jgi:putative heme iron utilization protein|uniref:DUF2470 domain-containing protein n=1 Tax=unclassified Aeromicrobium TaxID=2633570 RepID=UPI0007001FD0|nr:MULTISPECIES: DUF2470 domain-containing protein [unclassified Aeromicrobium]KQO38611.1 hypothetical protein ASF05_01555 [Aeromicrobium sp. Leaf245]KQP25378.1 hypothetical protein ASF38_12890 [Aeromicrobium sp. Leaf272]KQP80052.1 hypothetical protein ASF37_03395 [Aeromicrobium sp. Leaf289]RYY44411.1 MAG: DUF2470 domain-containing protein [Actinomycetales bacterium]
MTAFGPEVVAAVLEHMNADHRDDSLTIVQGHAVRRATSATMTGLDADGGDWSAVVDGVPVPVRVPWTERAVERADLRREIVRLHDAARERLDAG